MNGPVFGLIHEKRIYHAISVSKSIVSTEYPRIGSIRKSDRTVITLNGIKTPIILPPANGSDEYDFKIDSEGDEGPLEVKCVNYSRLFLRVDSSTFPLGVMNTKKIALIGLGSGGALIAAYLAKSGVKKLTLVDDDILEEHNIVRHICSLEDLGRKKTEAVKQYLQKRIGDLDVEVVDKTFALDTRADEKQFEKVFSGIDLIVAATGDHHVNARVNAFAYPRGIPTIYAGAFEKVIGGLMLFVDPKVNHACYECVTNNKGSAPKTLSSDVVVNYDRTMDNMLSQPGLGLDIDNITIFVSKFIIAKLLQSHDSKLFGFPYNFYIWYNKDTQWNGNNIEGLELYYFENKDKRPYCPVCNPEGV